MSEAALLAVLRQPLLVLFASLGLLLGGVQAWFALPIDAFPDVSSTQVKIIIKAPGMTPEEVEHRITTPIELEMLGIPHKRLVRSVSKFAIADITIDFDDRTDVYWARQLASERLAQVMRELPEGVSGGLAPVTTPLGEMFMFTLESPSHSLQERRTVLDWVIRPALRALPGVADVNALGGEVRSLEVVPDPVRMNARGITLDQLREAIRANNRSDGAGRIADQEESLVVRVDGAVRGEQDLRDTVIAQVQGSPVSIAEVAQVRTGSLTRYGSVTAHDSGETVQGLVLGLRGANAMELVRGVKAQLKELAPILPQGMAIRVFYDRTELVERAVRGIVNALAEAVVLVVLVLLVFLGNLRAAMVVALSLPLSLLVAVLAMRATGLSANLMSLGGLAIGIGMLIDAAVVVVEQTVARLDKTPAGANREQRARVIAQAVLEVGKPVLIGVTIIATVFLPLLSLEGLEGKLFRPVALTIVFALAGSLLLAFSLVPVVSLALLQSGSAQEPWLLRTATQGYQRVLAAALGHPRSCVGLALASLALAAALFPTIGRSFMPTMDEGSMIIQLQKSTAIRLEQSAANDLRIAQHLRRQVPEIVGIVTRVGSDDLGLDPMGPNESDMFLMLAPREQWRGDRSMLMAAIREALGAFPGTVHGFTQPIEMRVAEMLTGSRGDLVVKVQGPDLGRNQETARQIATLLRGLPGARDVISARQEGLRYLSITIDRVAAGKAGLSIEMLQDRLRAQLEGEQIGIVREGVRRTPLLLRGADDTRESSEDFAQLMIASPQGGAWPIQRLARMEEREGPVRIDHENTRRLAMVQASVEGRDLVGFVREARAAVAREIALGPEMQLQWGGQFENQQRAAARLAVVIPVALLAIFVLLSTSLGSVRQALLVFANIPFAAVGGVVALAISGEYLSVPASVGFIALLGIAVLNGVVMVSHFNSLLDQGLPMAEAVRAGALHRLRPVLMTASITALGMLPLILATGPGSEIQRPLAIVVIGGLVSATLLTLVLLPLSFLHFGRGRGGLR